MKTQRPMKIAIHIDEDKPHFSNWANPWISFCEATGTIYETVNCYTLNSIDELKRFDALLWHFSHYSKKDMTFARSILKSASEMGLSVFPETDDSWHFDDKIAQDYFLRSVNASIPNSKILYSHEAVKAWVTQDPELPIVAKLRCGSGSHNVKLLETKEDISKYSEKMFLGGGFSTTPSLIFKTKSNILSANSISKIIDRTKKIPHFIRTLKKSKSLDRESGYFYAQSLIPNDGFDLKIVVTGEKLSFIGRRSRNSDFRASGGGDLFYDRSFVTPEVIDLCFSTSKKIRSSCMGYDVVINKNSGIPYIIEMSYGFSHAALLEAGGHWNKNHDWIAEPLNAPEEIIKNIIKQVQRKVHHQKTSHAHDELELT